MIFEKKKGIILLIFLLASTTTVLIPVSSNTNEEHYINGVPLVDQEDKPWCGPGSVAMVLKYWFNDVSIDEVGEEIDSEKDGTCPGDILEYIRLLYPVTRFKSLTDDLLLKESFEELKKYIREGSPVIISRWSKYERGGHWCVVIGYDSKNIYIADPNGYEDSFKYNDFRKLWEKRNGLGVVIEPKDTDGDTVSNSMEKEFKTDPLKWDTDGDGLNDGEEIRVYKTDPLKQDTDNDGWNDKIETEKILFSPMNVFLPNIVNIVFVLFVSIRSTLQEVERGLTCGTNKKGLEGAYQNNETQ